MDDEIFLDILGDEPYSYIGYIHPRFTLVPQNAIHKQYSTANINLTTILVVGNSIHKINITKGVFEVSLEGALHSSIHKVITDSVTLGINLVVPNAIHKVKQYNKINAPVNFNCDTYLDTPYQGRILDTERTQCCN